MANRAPRTMQSMGSYERQSLIFEMGERVYDEGTGIVYEGDGSTLGGMPLQATARQSQVSGSLYSAAVGLVGLTVGADERRVIANQQQYQARGAMVVSGRLILTGSLRVSGDDAVPAGIATAPADNIAPAAIVAILSGTQAALIDRLVVTGRCAVTGKLRVT